MIYYSRQFNKKKMEDGTRSQREFFIILTSKFLNPTFKRCECSQCNTHLGAIFFDGPPPSFLRYVVNSDMLKFYDMPDFPYPIPPRL